MPGRVRACDTAWARGTAPEPEWGGVALLTDEERSAHRAKMQSLASYDECKAYMADFSKQVQARAKEKGVAVYGPNEVMCDRMKQHGRFTQ